MKFDWEVFKKFDDGSQSTRCYAEVYKNDNSRLCSGWIEDHTKERAKKDDKKTGREVPFAFVICGFDSFLSFDVLKNVFEKHGYSGENYGYVYYNSLGICPNENYRESTYEYTGTPKCSIEEVMEMVEEAVVESISFDYEKELEEYKKELNERQALMDEAVAFLNERGK